MNGKQYAIKRAFSEAIQELLKDKELDKITVPDILSKAEMSKSTFYRYFPDKYALANWSYANLMQEVEDVESLSDFTMFEIVRKEVKMISDNKSTFRKLFNYTGQNSIYKYYVERSIEIAKNTLNKSGKDLTSEDTYSIIYNASGMLAVIREWLEEKEPGSVEKITEIIYSNRSEHAKSLYFK